MRLIKFATKYPQWIAVTLSIIGIALNANKYILSWPVWITSNIFWILYSFPKKEWSYVLLWTVFIAFNAYGWYQWL